MLEDSVLSLVFPKNSGVKYSYGCSNRRVDIAGEGWHHELRSAAFLFCLKLLSWLCKFGGPVPLRAAIRTAPGASQV